MSEKLEEYAGYQSYLNIPGLKRAIEALEEYKECCLTVEGKVLIELIIEELKMELK